MPVQATIDEIVEAPNWSQRIARIRLIPQRHGTADHIAIYAQIARRLYLPALSPDFAYVPDDPFYDAAYFAAAYQAAFDLTDGFASVSEHDLAHALNACSTTLLVFRTLVGLGRDELAHATALFALPRQLDAVSASTINTMERTARSGRSADGPALVLAGTLGAIMEGSLFGPAPEGWHLKQTKPDTELGWDTVRSFAQSGVPFSVFLHQRHYGGAFRQLLDATSSKRGDILENEVERIFSEAGLGFIRTGSHNQAEVAARFEIMVTPAPDFVVFNPEDDALQALLECKGANDGGTARDKALRFARLRSECVRLGGIPLIAVLGGIGWARIKDALAPVIRDCEGRVFTLATLGDILRVPPFPNLQGIADRRRNRDT